MDYIGKWLRQVWGHGQDKPCTVCLRLVADLAVYVAPITCQNHHLRRGVNDVSPGTTFRVMIAPSFDVAYTSRVGSHEFELLLDHQNTTCTRINRPGFRLRL